MRISRIAMRITVADRRIAPTLSECGLAVRSGMTRFLARRLLNYFVLLVLASFLTYCLTSRGLLATGQPCCSAAPARRNP